MGIGNSRGVTVCDQDAKTLGSHTRPPILLAAGNLMVPTAMGSGFNGGLVTRHNFWSRRTFL